MFSKVPVNSSPYQEVGGSYWRIKALFLWASLPVSFHRDFLLAGQQSSTTCFKRKMQFYLISDLDANMAGEWENRLYVSCVLSFVLEHIPSKIYLTNIKQVPNLVHNTLLLSTPKGRPKLSVTLQTWLKCSLIQLGCVGQHENHLYLPLFLLVNPFQNMVLIYQLSYVKLYNKRNRSVKEKKINRNWQHQKGIHGFLMFNCFILQIRKLRPGEVKDMTMVT